MSSREPDLPAEPTALEPRVLDEIRVVGGERLLRELLEIFQERTPLRLAAAESALAEADLEAAARAFHSLCSAAGSVGASRLADQAARLERAARSGGGGGLKDGLARLRRTADETLAASRRLCAAADG